MQGRCARSSSEPGCRLAHRKEHPDESRTAAAGRVQGTHRPYLQLVEEQGQYAAKESVFLPAVQCGIDKGTDGGAPVVTASASA